ncbi:hypothetical protein ACH4FX_39095 [Streptomyces sp. NPDC018019]|uniref:hypothetical protein n=1 Tax=Streptomyces sp. NPDC018019 TaxID=3365030 RepID=UPI0037B300BB
MSVHLSLPVDGTRTPEDDELLQEMRQQTADRQAVYPPGKYTVEVELECPADAVPDLREAVACHGDRAVTVVGPLDVTTTGAPVGHKQLAQQVVTDIVMGLFRWNLGGRHVSIVRFGAVPGHLSRLADAIPAAA